EFLLQTRSAITAATCPGFRSVPVTAFAAIVRVLDLCEIKILFPVWTLFLQRRRAVAHFHPAGGVVAAQPGIFHIAKIFALRNGAFAQSLTLDRVEQVFFASGLHPRSDQITQTNIFYYAEELGALFANSERLD